MGRMSACGALAAVALLATHAAADYYTGSLHYAHNVPAGASRTAFAEWARHNGKAYAPGSAEFERRYPAFQAAVAHVTSLKAHQNALVVPVNGLADISTEEFRGGFLGQSLAKRLQDLPPGVDEPFRYSHLETPEAVDWREKGVVGPIKDQHVNHTACGCCWTFAATGVMECLSAMATGEVVALSEQQLIDCDKAAPYSDEGCEGGDFEGGILYATEQGNGGLDSEEDYPYTAKDGQCRTRKEGHVAGSMDGLVRVPHQNETALQQAVSQHPTAVAVCCGDYIDNWHHYTGGIFDIEGAAIPGGCTEPIDHALVAVGYGTSDKGEEYWIIKNSWSLSWGDKGFLYVPRNVGAANPKGAFGLATAPGFPVKKGVNSKADPFIDFDEWEKPSSDAGSALNIMQELHSLTRKAVV